MYDRNGNLICDNCHQAINLTPADNLPGLGPVLCRGCVREDAVAQAHHTLRSLHLCELLDASPGALDVACGLVGLDWPSDRPSDAEIRHAVTVVQALAAGEYGQRAGCRRLGFCLDAIAAYDLHNPAS